MAIVLIIVGFIYIIKPDLYNKRMLLKEPAAGRRTFSVKNYNLMMRVLGVAIIIIGIISLLKHR